VRIFQSRVLRPPIARSRLKPPGCSENGVRRAREEIQQPPSLIGFLLRARASARRVGEPGEETPKALRERAEDAEIQYQPTLFSACFCRLSDAGNPLTTQGWDIRSLLVIFVKEHFIELGLIRAIFMTWRACNTGDLPMYRHARRSQCRPNMSPPPGFRCGHLQKARKRPGLAMLRQRRRSYRAWFQSC
jgi:hypothetical protein